MRCSTINKLSFETSREMRSGTLLLTFNWELGERYSKFCVLKMATDTSVLFCVSNSENNYLRLHSHDTTISATKEPFHSWVMFRFKIELLIMGSLLDMANLLYTTNGAGAASYPSTNFPETNNRQQMNSAKRIFKGGNRMVRCSCICISWVFHEHPRW